MNTSRFRVETSFLVSLLVAAPGAFGDSVCNAGYRDTTAAERAKMTATLETIRSAMPAPAAGWVISGDDAISVPQSLCQDYAKVPLDYRYTRHYSEVGNAEQRMKLMNDQAALQAAAYQKKQPRLEAIQAQMQAVVAQQIPLLQKGDVAGAEKYNAQIAKLQDEYQKVADEGSNPEATEAAYKELNLDTELTISVSVNPLTARVPADAKPAALPARAKSAYRWHVEDTNSSNDHAQVHFGTWFKRPDGTLQPMPRKGAPFSAAHGFTIEVIGDPERVTKTLAAIDFAKVAAVLE
jgi:hypothetical protein